MSFSLIYIKLEVASKVRHSSDQSWAHHSEGRQRNLKVGVLGSGTESEARSQRKPGQEGVELKRQSEIEEIQRAQCPEAKGGYGISQRHKSQRP